MSSEIPFIRPSFPSPEELAADFTSIVEANWFTNFGPQERHFARLIADYVGPGHSASTFANGTLALMAGVSAAFTRSDASPFVLMPAFTFVAVPQSAIWAGFRPFFFDIDPHSWQPSLASAREAVEQHPGRFAGILLANVFGVGNPEIEAWEAFAAEWDLPLVIDSAAGFGSSYSDRERVGGRGRCEIFSFHATKPFAIGEGGGLVSRHPEVTEAADRFQNFGFTPDRQSARLGLNGKLQELSAAIGIRQLAGLDERLEQRRAVLATYVAELTDSGLRFQDNAERSSLCFAAALCPDAAAKQDLLARMGAARIGARDYYNPPLHRHGYFLAERDTFERTDLDVTEDVCRRIVSLPIHDGMDEAVVQRVVAAAR